MMRGSTTLAAIAAILLSSACTQRAVIQVSDYHARHRPLPERIVLVVWNAQKGGDPGFEADLARLIAAESPDLVFLQEARADLLATKRIGGHFASSWSYPWPNGTTIGILTLSHVPPVSIRPVRSRHKEFVVTAPKMSLVTVYPLANGERLMAVNVHLLAFERWSTTGIAAQLADLQRIMADHEGPIIFAGDFNTWSRERLALVEEVAERLGLTEVDDFPEGRKSTDEQTPFLDGLLGIDAPLPLDRVYYRGFRHQSAKVLPYATSDHAAIRVTLEATPGSVQEQL